MRLTQEQGDFNHHELAAANPMEGYPRYLFAREWIRRMNRETDVLERTATATRDAPRGTPARYRVRSAYLSEA